MTNNEKKEWLQRYRECWAEVEITQQEIEELNSRAQKITASLSPTPGGGQRADFTLTVDRIIELKEKLDQQVRLLCCSGQKLRLLLSRYAAHCTGVCCVGGI